MIPTSRRLRAALKRSGVLWEASCCSGMLRAALAIREGSGGLPGALANSGKLWQVLEGSERVSDAISLISQILL